MPPREIRSLCKGMQAPGHHQLMGSLVKPKGGTVAIFIARLDAEPIF